MLLLLILIVTNFALSSCSQDDELKSLDLAHLSASLIKWQVAQGYTPSATLPAAAMTDLSYLRAVDVPQQPHKGGGDDRDREEFMEWKRYKALHAKFGSN